MMRAHSAGASVRIRKLRHDRPAIGIRASVRQADNQRAMRGGLGRDAELPAHTPEVIDGPEADRALDGHRAFPVMSEDACLLAAATVP